MYLTFTAGQTQTESLQANSFYFKGGTSAISVKALMGGETKTYLLEPGMGFRLQGNARFNSLEINSASAQIIEFEVNDAEIFDNRAVLSLSSAMPVSQVVAGSRASANAALSAGVAGKVLVQDLTRRKASLYFSQDTYIGKDNTVSSANGYFIPAGSDITDECTAELWAVSAVAQTVQVIASNT